MHTIDVLKYGHQTVFDTIDNLDEKGWTRAGACGVWSAKDIIAHLASYEHILIDVLNTFLHDGPTPTLEQFGEVGPEQFNNAEVARRANKPVDEVVAEYTEMHEKTVALAEEISIDMRRQTGTLPWYGLEYALDDFIVYTFYGHKREHCAQIDVFRNRLSLEHADAQHKVTHGSGSYTRF